MICGVGFSTAKYRGIPFEMLPISHSGGRRIITHLYPFSNEHYNEDLGDKPEKFSVKGRFVGKNFRDQMQAAKRIWQIQGDGVLFEPVENRSHVVRLLSWSFDYQPTSVNYVEFTLEFIEAGNDPYPSSNGLTGNVNNLVTKYIESVNNAQIANAKIVAKQQDSINSIKAAYGFLDNAVRQVVTNTAFNAVSDAVVSAIGVAEQ